MKEIKWDHAKAMSGWVVAAVLALTLVGVTFAMSPTFPATIEPGSMVGSAAYTVFTDGVNTFVKNGTTGAIAFSGASALTTIQSVLSLRPPTLLIRAGTYTLNGNLTATSPIIISGETNGTQLVNGGLTINGNGWTATKTIVQDLKFLSPGTYVQLKYKNVVSGKIEDVAFVKTSPYALDKPALALNNSDSIQVIHNWFDNYQMQLINISGPAITMPLHSIVDNDFGSTAAAFPAFTNPCQVAAVCIWDSTEWGIAIDSNLAFLNAENILVYSMAQKTAVTNNQFTGGSGNYAIDLRASNNKVTGNQLGLRDTSLGAIAIRDPNSLVTVKDYNVISDNIIWNGLAAKTIYGVMQHSVISDNTMTAVNGITLYNSAYNSITGNSIQKTGPGPWMAVNESGSSGYNVVSGNKWDSTMGTAYKASSLWVDNLGFNPQGWAIGTGPMPGSGSDSGNPYPFPILVYITGVGTGITAVGITDAGGTLVSFTMNVTVGMYFEESQGGKIRLTYTGSPTWKWYGM